MLTFNKNLTSQSEITIYVADSPEFAKSIKQAIKKIDLNKALIKVIHGKELPKEKPSLIYIGSQSLAQKIIQYTRANKVLSITGDYDTYKKGATMCAVVNGNKKAQIFINPKGSIEENCNWKNSVFKFATLDV